MKKDKNLNSSFDNPPSTIQIDEIDRSNTYPINIAMNLQNQVSPVKYPERNAFSKTSTLNIPDLQMKHASLGSENLRFSESGITTVEIDSTLPNPMEFMQALVQCDSE